MNSYTVGTAVKCQMTFYSDEAQTTPADPTGVTFTIRPPDAGATTYTYGTDAELVKSGTGVYYVIWGTASAADGVGEYFYRFAGTGSVVEAKEGKFRTQTLFT